MSRMIPGKPVAGGQEALYDTDSGKLLITKWNGRRMVLLVHANRLCQACVLSDVQSMVGAVYLGKVKKIVRNIGACFVDLNFERLVYLSMSEQNLAYLTNRKEDGRLLEGDEVVVQIQHEALKTKQEAVTAAVSLAGRYVVVYAGEEPKLRMSEKLSTERKKELFAMLLEAGRVDSEKNILDEAMPEGAPGYGIILRTEAGLAAREEILEEWDQMRERFETLYHTAKHRTCFSLLCAPASPCEEAVAQISGTYAEVVTDQADLYEEMKAYFETREIPFRLYTDEAYPLSLLYSLESRLQEALSRRVWLKSGAYLIIDVTEALIVIDVNSGKNVTNKATEEAILSINLEAAKEIAFQLILRNLSGMILVDFISMKSAKCQGELLHTMRRLLKEDRVPTQAIDITPLGLMELTRKKIRKSLAEQLKRSNEEKRCED